MTCFEHSAQWFTVADAQRLSGAHQLSVHTGAPRCLLLHGNPASMADWCTLVHELRGKFELLILDLPGFGQSDAIEPKPTFTQLDTAADCAHAAALGVGWTTPYYVIGHSHGAAVALTLVARCPDAVARLVLLASLGTPAHAAYRQLALPGMEALLGGVAALVKMKALRLLMRSVVAGIMSPMFAPAPLPEPLVDRQLEAFVLRPSLFVHMVRLARENPSQQLARDCTRVRAPTLFIHGANDKLVPAARAQQLCSLLTQATSTRFETISSAGHMLHVTHAAQVVQQLDSWLTRAV